MTQRFRNWCFTEYNMNFDWETVYRSNENIRYICVGKEVCPTTQRPHLQGWVQLEKPRRLSTMKKEINKECHWAGCRGDEFSNEKYCKKDNDFKTFGQFKTQGYRTDLEGLFEQIENGTKIKEIIKYNPQLYCKYRNGIKDWYDICQQEQTKKWRDVEVHVLTGYTGTGKTRLAMEEATYKTSGSRLNWWCRYRDDEVICIDEYDSNIPIVELLELLDGYQLELPVKGSSTWANWNKVYITSNVPLDQWHLNAKPMHRRALMRRVTKWSEFRPDGTIITKNVN